MEVVPAGHDFGRTAACYEPVEPVCFVIRNTGTLPLEGLCVSSDEGEALRFWLCLAPLADRLDAAGGETCETRFFAYPMDGLPCAVHTARLSVSADGIEPIAVELRFTVSPAADSGSAGSPDRRTQRRS